MKKILYILVFLTLCIGIDRINAYTEYKIGDEITYNGIKFYVIKDSSKDEDNVTMLKAEPLTVDEVNQYGVGHVNRYTASSAGTAYDNNGYGGMAYYTSETCGYVNGRWVNDGCITDYEESEVKYVVDAWKSVNVPAATEARLIAYDELINNLGYNHASWNASYWKYDAEYTPSWVYNENYYYWTMSRNNDSSVQVWYVYVDGSLGTAHCCHFGYSDTVRPVITLSKTVLGDVDESIVEDNETVDDKNVKGTNETKVDTKENVEDKTNESKSTVKVANTYMSSSILLIILGFITASISVFVLYRFRNKKR